ncbi:hypothetical protein FNF29_06573 [Cafeteria roenbergensis]|uniref:Uncharacterized protein n=1 Tax=Cafeteria roenbergensis TaxID=33653 RepID=A0A5A8C6H2_CAFRO|nr:hypothetical protein FNF29_06573 [Cafeteria roenbergensis]|eukprot:KAA0148636.1 hypothetical protein FNF29_06573 [Cafeteria roenbergensis]
MAAWGPIVGRVASAIAVESMSTVLEAGSEVSVLVTSRTARPTDLVAFSMVLIVEEWVIASAGAMPEEAAELMGRAAPLLCLTVVPALLSRFAEQTLAAADAWGFSSTLGVAVGSGQAGGLWLLYRAWGWTGTPAASVLAEAAYCCPGACGGGNHARRGRWGDSR